MAEPSRIHRGVHVFCKDDPEQREMLVIDGPPAIIGSRRKSRGVFPIELNQHVYVQVNLKGKQFVCIEHIDNLKLVSQRGGRDTKKKRRKRKSKAG